MEPPSWISDTQRHGVPLVLAMMTCCLLQIQFFERGILIFEGSEMKQKACGLGVILTCDQIPWMPPGSLAFQKLNLNLCLCAVGGAYLPHRLVVSLSGNKGKGSRGPLQGSWESPRDNPHCF